MNIEEGTSLCDIKYKIVLLGDMSVGKSSIIERFIKGYLDQKRLQHTVGIDYLAKNVGYENRTYRLQLWDTAGQEKFRSLIPAYLRDAHCAVFVFDLSLDNSFDNIDKWVEMFHQCHHHDAAMVLVGNKTDLKRKVQADTMEYARKCGMGYCEVSAKTGDNIENLFESIIENIKINGKSREESTGIDGEEDNTGSKINKEKALKINKAKHQKSPCCYI